MAATSLNSLVLFSIWKTPSLHKPSFILIANLAITDLVVGFIAEPLMALTNIAALKEWTWLFCHIWIIGRAVGYTMGAMSLNTLAAISVDRLLAIKLKERYRSVVTMKRVFAVLLGFWTSTCCFSVLINSYIDKVVIILSVYLFVLVGTLTFCYASSFYSLRKLTSPVTPNNIGSRINTDESQISPPLQPTSLQPSSLQPPPRLPYANSIFRVSRFKRSLNTMLLMLMIIIFFYFPYFCALVMTAVIYKVVPNASHSQFRMLNYKCMTMGELIVFVNSTMNPVIYLWRLKDIRQGAITVMRRIFGKKTTERTDS
ncbi:beta-1 adrenergic receptor-like [Actinia tenebrosa]|uniref:Beta-1 adrenergic receptor-like n=1 Tax=Actinia tenebrosa TaxID=6105 RepID=A0A6P8IIK6_ACTTE|nr:beta-1 adrenergic receptor-like [Actinia tenebrosa]